MDHVRTIIGLFAIKAPFIGFPVKMIDQVLDDKAVSYIRINDDDPALSYYDPKLLTVALNTKTVAVLSTKSIWDMLVEKYVETAIPRLYHEFTHAWLDRQRDKDTSVAKITQDGIAYYTGAPLEDGTTADDTPRVFTEALATYVEERIAQYCHAARWVVKALIEERGANRETQQYMKGFMYPRLETNALGYQERYSIDLHVGPTWIKSRQVRTTKPMFDQFTNYCDNVILEGKVGYTPLQSATLRSLRNTLDWELEHKGLRKTP